MVYLKFIVDECVGIQIAKWLESKDCDVISISTMMPGAKDSTILDKAFSENRVIITSDKDFGELVFNKKISHVGIIFIVRPIVKTTLTQKFERLPKLRQ